MLGYLIEALVISAMFGHVVAVGTCIVIQDEEFYGEATY